MPFVAPISWIKVFLITIFLLLSVLSALWWVSLPRFSSTKPSSKKINTPGWHVSLPSH